MRDVVSLYLIDLQKLSPETGSPRREQRDEFSERRKLGSLLPTMVTSNVKNTVQLNVGIYKHATLLVLSPASIYGAVPLSRETGFSPWEEGRDTKVVLRDSRYGL